MSGRGSADSASDATREDLKLKPMVGYIRIDAKEIKFSKTENIGKWDDDLRYLRYRLGPDLDPCFKKYKDEVLFPVLEDGGMLHTWP